MLLVSLIVLAVATAGACVVFGYLFFTSNQANESDADDDQSSAAVGEEQSWVFEGSSEVTSDHELDAEEPTTVSEEVESDGTGDESDRTDPDIQFFKQLLEPVTLDEFTGQVVNDTSECDGSAGVSTNSQLAEQLAQLDACESESSDEQKPESDTQPVLDRSTRPGHQDLSGDEPAEVAGDELKLDLDELVDEDSAEDNADESSSATIVESPAVADSVEDSPDLSEMPDQKKFPAARAEILRQAVLAPLAPPSEVATVQPPSADTSAMQALVAMVVGNGGIESSDDSWHGTTPLPRSIDDHTPDLFSAASRELIKQELIIPTPPLNFDPDR
ncbi:MAG: hypothetical protein V1738_01855 [Patescibacteria group bacterium]